MSNWYNKMNESQKQYAKLKKKKAKQIYGQVISD